MIIRDKNLYLRASIINSIREFFNSRDFLEVETPLRIPANAPEEYIDPFATENLYLQTSPEICMKRLLCRGHKNIYQISRCWRKGERGRRHLPEFTMLEWYRADSDYLDLMNDCDELLAHVATKCGTHTGEQIIQVGKAERITVQEAFQRYSKKEMFESVQDHSFDECIVTEIEPALPHNRPVILMDYPAPMASLARLKTIDNSVAERFELYLGGLELANGFSELNDPAEQKMRFTETNLHRKAGGLSPLPLPEPFLKELASMPVSAGIALGVDRLVMLLSNAEKIDDVVTFTPEEL